MVFFTDVPWVCVDGCVWICKELNVYGNLVCISTCQTNVLLFYDYLLAALFLLLCLFAIIIWFPAPSTGSGTSKKLAKRNAAAKMLSRIHDVPVDLRTNNEADPEDDNFHMVRNTPQYVKILHGKINLHVITIHQNTVWHPEIHYLGKKKLHLWKMH